LSDFTIDIKSKQKTDWRQNNYRRILYWRISAGTKIAERPESEGYKQQIPDLSRTFLLHSDVLFIAPIELGAAFLSGYENILFDQCFN
jgi:hypothetical protein